MPNILHVPRHLQLLLERIHLLASSDEGPVKCGDVRNPHGVDEDVASASGDLQHAEDDAQPGDVAIAVIPVATKMRQTPALDLSKLTEPVVSVVVLYQRVTHHDCQVKEFNTSQPGSELERTSAHGCKATQCRARTLLKLESP
jgi:hypothetical protein